MTRAPKTLLTAGGAVGLVALSALIHPDPFLVWNASASVPIGLYAVRAIDTPKRGDLVLADPPEPLADWLVERGYLGPDMPLIKHVAALSGQKVCRRGLTITIDGKAVAIAKAHDRLGRRLPKWQGCHRLSETQVFFLNPNTPSSLDGRYFGPLERDTIAGRAVPIWTREN